jgi:hypothetical protein
MRTQSGNQRPIQFVRGLDVLISSETTLDSIQLNQAGHKKMAEIVWEIIAPAIASGDGVAITRGFTLELRPLFPSLENLLIPVMNAHSTSG